MNAHSWRLAACGAILIGVGAACSVTATGTPLDGFDAGSLGPGSDGGGTKDATGGGNKDSGGIGPSMDSGVTMNPDTGAGTCSIPMVFSKPACQTCMNDKCCAEVNACVADNACVKLNNCLVGCQADGGGPPDDAGITPCEKQCAMAAPQTALDEFNGIGTCLGGKCKTECM